MNRNVFITEGLDIIKKIIIISFSSESTRPSLQVGILEILHQCDYQFSILYFTDTNADDTCVAKGGGGHKGSMALPVDRRVKRNMGLVFEANTHNLPYNNDI